MVYSITSDSGPTQLSMVLDTTVASSATRQWQIRVLQYECSSRNLGKVILILSNVMYEIVAKSELVTRLPKIALLLTRHTALKLSLSD